MIDIQIDFDLVSISVPCVGDRLGEHGRDAAVKPVGEVVQDVRRITTLPETPPGSYPVQVGLFYEGSGRLPVVAPDGRPLDERVLLGPVRVRGE